MRDDKTEGKDKRRCADGIKGGEIVSRQELKNLIEVFGPKTTLGDLRSALELIIEMGEKLKEVK